MLCPHNLINTKCQSKWQTVGLENTHTDRNSRKHANLETQIGRVGTLVEGSLPGVTSREDNSQGVIHI